MADHDATIFLHDLGPFDKVALEVEGRAPHDLSIKINGHEFKHLREINLRLSPEEATLEMAINLARSDMEIELKVDSTVFNLTERIPD